MSAGEPAICCIPDAANAGHRRAVKQLDDMPLYGRTDIIRHLPRDALDIALAAFGVAMNTNLLGIAGKSPDFVDFAMSPANVTASNIDQLHAAGGNLEAVVIDEDLDGMSVGLEGDPVILICHVAALVTFLACLRTIHDVANRGVAIAEEHGGGISLARFVIGQGLGQLGAARSKPRLHCLISRYCVAAPILSDRKTW